MTRKRFSYLVLLAASAALVGCGYSPRDEFMTIRSASVKPIEGDGTRIVANDLPTSSRGIGRADRALARDGR
jgi:hypothetical protein